MMQTGGLDAISYNRKIVRGGLTTVFSIPIIDSCVCLAHVAVVAPRRLVLPG
jgi:hypothetical protein